MEENEVQPGVPSDKDQEPDFENYGSDGGSSQWGQRVLRVENDEVVVEERTLSRDKGKKKFNEEKKG